MSYSEAEGLHLVIYLPAVGYRSLSDIRQPGRWRLLLDALAARASTGALGLTRPKE